MSDRNMSFGTNPEGSTFVFGNVQQDVGRIFIEGHRQFAGNDFSALFNRFGTVNNIRNRDYQIAISEVFGSPKQSKL